MSRVMLVNITWNPFGWQDDTYVNPRAGHNYAKQNVGGEALNFKFNKKDVDTKELIRGYFQCTNNPKRFEKGGIIIFYTNNTDKKQGQIVGIYGKATFDDTLFNDYAINISGETDYSMLFPFPLGADKYKETQGQRLVPQVGFTYKDINFAEKIIYDELTEMSESSGNEKDFIKLSRIYEYYVGKKFDNNFEPSDEKEQSEILGYYKRKSDRSLKVRAKIVEELQNLKETSTEKIEINGKIYKRDNETIAKIKLIRNFECQICGKFILKKDGSRYIEAAHIQPKYQRGRETPDNILLLCPNHHKEFDYGEVKILSHTMSEIEFLMNSMKYKLDLSVK